MGSKHLLDGLIRLSTREPWSDRFEQVLEDHLMPACDEAGLEVDEIVATIGQDLFRSVVWACAFEDFLTREFDDGENAIDDYLKRRGWKESASVRSYMAALRNSTMSLYEVSDIVRGSSFRARDLIRGGEPVLVSERSATESLRPWDRIAARVVRVGSKTQIGGGVLAFDHQTSEAFTEALRKLDSLSIDEKREILEADGQDFDEAALAELSPTERLRAIAPMFTTFWLLDAIEVHEPEIPELRNSEGDELMRYEVSYPLIAGTTGEDIRAALQERPEFRSMSTTTWDWISQRKPAAARSDDGGPGGESVTIETWQDDGTLVLGVVQLRDNTLVLTVNSQQRSDRGRALLSDILGPRVGQPSVKAESVEQIMASHDAAMPDLLDLPDEEQHAMIHSYLDRHYRDVLDQPVAMLGGRTPRAAAKTDAGRTKVVDWLKLVENRTANTADPNSPLANYSFGWLWTELGISDLRR